MRLLLTTAHSGYSDSDLFAVNRKRKLFYEGLLILFLCGLLTAPVLNAATTWSFTPPDSRTDGTPLSASEIASYEVEVDGTLYSNLAGNMTVLSLEGLDTREHCLILRTVDTDGRVSTNSERVCKPGDTIIIVPPPPSAEIPADVWTVVDYSSFELENWHMPPECLFDRGDPCGQSPIWHSRYLPVEAQPPHWVTIDLGAVYTITGFRYHPRPNGGNGTPLEFNYSVSQDLQTWTVVATGTAPPGDFPVDSPVDTLFGPVTGQYVRFTVLSEQDGGNQAAVDELYVMGESVRRPKAPVMVE
jgi:hypothetical protein